MHHTRISVAFLTASLLCTTASAGERAERDQQRNVAQQQRIEQGLRSGELTTQEAGRLEREQQHVERVESRALQDGGIGAAEQAHITAAENRASADIYRQKHDAAEGHPNSASSRRLQRDVRRDANQQQRIQSGLDDGSLTNREAASLERGQARNARRQANATADGHVGPIEQRAIRVGENRQSRRIYRNKHD
jgi:hypothetical protein